MPTPQNYERIKPMLLHNYAPHLVKYPCYAQIKYNGVHAIWHQRILRSRDGKHFSRKVLPHIYAALTHAYPETSLCGELWADVNWPLQRTNSACAVKRKEPNADSSSIQFVAFDVIPTSLDQTFAWRFVEREFDKYQTPGIIVARAKLIATPEELKEYYYNAIYLKHEGVIVRNHDSLYRQDYRSYTTLKLKPWQSCWFKCVGIEEGKGKYRKTFGSFVGETKEGRVFTVGSGVFDEERAALWDGWAKAKAHPAFVKVKFEEFSADKIPLKPVVQKYVFDPATAAKEHVSMEPVWHHNI